jgi:hypothetical protein
MTRKDYIAIASVLSGLREERTNRINWFLTCGAFAEMLNENSGFDLNGNRRFDRDRFLTACAEKK